MQHAEQYSTNLQHYNEEQNTTGNGHFKSTENHDAAAYLANQIDQYKHGSQKLATAPAHVHVFALFIPLNPHTDTIF